MRVVYLINAPGEGVSGAGQHTLSLAAQDLARGDEAIVVAPRGSGMHSAARAVGAVAVEAPMTALPWDIIALRGSVRELAPDIVHAMSFVPLLLAGCAGSRRAARPATFVSYLVDPASALPMARTRFKTLAMRTRNAVARRYAPNVDAIFTISSTIRDRLAELGIGGRVVLARGGVDLETLRERSRKAFDAPDRHPRIGWAAVDQVPSKGAGFLIRALARIVDEYPGAVCMLTGRPSAELDIPGLARELGVSDNVTLLGLIDDPAPFMAVLDVYVMPSLSEALNTSVIEAMALGVPVVATDVGGTREIVEHGRTGLLVPAGDAVALAGAIGRILSDDEDAQRMAREGRRWIEQEFDRRRLYEITEAEYRAAICRAHHRT